MYLPSSQAAAAAREVEVEVEVEAIDMELVGRGSPKPLPPPSKSSLGITCRMDLQSCSVRSAGFLVVRGTAVSRIVAKTGDDGDGGR